MGYYVQVPENKNKIGQLQIMYNAMRIPLPISFDKVPANMALLCIVNNGPFEAVGYAYSEREFEAMANTSDRRPKEWALMDKTLVHKLVGFDTSKERK